MTSTIHLITQRTLIPWAPQFAKIGKITKHASLEQLPTAGRNKVRLLIIDLTVACECELLDFCKLNRFDIVAVFGTQLSVQFAVSLMHAGGIPFVGGSNTEQSVEYILSCQKRKKALLGEYLKVSYIVNALPEEQFDTLRSMLSDLPNKRIAKRLGIAERTVESRRSKIFERFEVDSLIQLTRVLHKYALLQEMFEPNARLKAAEIDRSLGMPAYTALSTLQFRTASGA